MLLAQTVNSLNNEGQSVDVVFNANHVFYLLLRISSTMGSDVAQCKNAPIFCLRSLLLP